MIAYTQEMCLDDLMALLPYAKPALTEMGALITCACCSAESQGVVTGTTTDGITVMALCKNCLDRDPRQMQTETWKMARESYFDIPATHVDRRKLIEMVRTALIHCLAEQARLPAVMRMLELDYVVSPYLPRDALGVVVRQTGKRIRAFRCPVPWHEDDPFILGGKFARDSSALVDSILSGKTKGYSFMGGPLILTSDDDRLVKEWSKP